MLSLVFKRKKYVTFCFVVVVFVIAGCGKGGLERVPISGTVSYDGQPVDQGTIRFAPLQGQSIPLSAAHIKDGKYNADSKGGVAVGEYRVEIEAFKQGEPANPNRPLPPGVERSSTGWIQFMPPKYGTESELRFKVESGAGSITKDFDLSP